jgi:tight adherence protein B
VILIISQESGGRLGDTLERLATTLRARAELGMKVQAKTSEARASAKIVALLVPGVLLYMYLNAPEDFRFMFNDPAGLKVMTYVAISVGLGLLITHLMVKRIR